MKTGYSENDIIDIIKRIYPQATNIQKMNEGLVSQTYYFKNLGISFVFQISTDKLGYEKENYVFKTFSKDISVKNILKIENYQDDIYYCISEYIDAKRLHDLTTYEIKEKIFDIMDILETMKNINIDYNKGYGYFDSKGDAPYGSWKGFIQAVINDKEYKFYNIDMKKNNVIEKSLNEIEKYYNILDERKCLIHGDFGSYNVLSNDKTIFLIDWSLGLYGDPLYEIANVLFWNEKCLNPLIKEINKKIITDDNIRLKIYIYMLRTGLEEINMNLKNNNAKNNEWLNNRIEDIIKNYWKKSTNFV